MNSGATFFLLGLGSFLLAHVAYAFAFVKSTINEEVKFSWLKLLPFLALIGILLPILARDAGDMTLPVVVYGIVIVGMLFVSFLRKGETSESSFRSTFAGAAAFILSDALIGWTKFVAPIEYGQVLIMSTYCLAQYLIITGIIEHNNSQSAY